MKDLTGQKFGRLTVIEKTGKGRDGHAVWKCFCGCGNIIEVRGSHLLSGHTKSCGCLNEEKIIKHGDNRVGRTARLYIIWRNMKQRCQEPNHPSYKWYGGKGIRVCDEWENNYLAFKAWALVNGYREDLTIDRIDNDGDYSPGNCQWITNVENAKKQWRDKKRA